jgi:hypothetical protein
VEPDFAGGAALRWHDPLRATVYKRPSNPPALIAATNVRHASGVRVTWPRSRDLLSRMHTTVGGRRPAHLHATPCEAPLLAFRQVSLPHRWDGRVREKCVACAGGGRLALPRPQCGPAVRAGVRVGLDGGSGLPVTPVFLRDRSPKVSLAPGPDPAGPASAAASAPVSFAAFEPADLVPGQPAFLYCRSQDRRRGGRA